MLAGGRCACRVAHRCDAPHGNPARVARQLQRLTPVKAQSLAVAPAQTGCVDAIVRTKGNRLLRIRPYLKANDFSDLVQLQFASFYTPHPFPPVNELGKASFRAEVLDAVRKKERHRDPSTFLMLVAEDVTSLEAELANIGGSSSSNGSSSLDLRPVQLPGQPDSDLLPLGWGPTPEGLLEGQGQLVGTVEMTLMDEAEVVRALGTDAEGLYVYISSMAVAESARRQGLAHALLLAAEQQARLWEQAHLALHVYADNQPAVQMYKKYGFRQVASDPEWKKMLGGRVRLLMHRELQLAH